LAGRRAALALFHATFVIHRKYAPTTYDVLHALDALSGSAAQARSPAWPVVFFAAFALAGLALRRRPPVTEPRDSSDGAPPSAPNKDSLASDVLTSKSPHAPSSTAPSAPSGGTSRNERMITIGIAAACVVAALLIGRSCGSRGAQSPAAATSAGLAADPAAEAVNAGLQATDADAAVAHFRKALEVNPTHYGATFQLARALDRAGRRDEAKQQWQRVLQLAEPISDQPIIDEARARLGGGRAPAAAPAAGDAMAAGLDALYTRRDPATAATRFREVLAQNPEHYGATFQLATALDMVGDTGGSRPLWERMLKMAEALDDAKTVETARARLAELDKLAPPVVSDDPDAEAMNAGLEALYKKRDAAAAEVQFRKVLARNPAHYGATFQLATALDQLGQPVKARPYWEKSLKMAEAIQDAKTVEVARARLLKKP